MRERPMIFGPESVRALLAGRKSQTRRVYKPRNPEPWELPPGEGYRDDWTPWPMYQDTDGDFHPVRCPYGLPGDRLFVKEGWAVEPGYRPILDIVHYRADCNPLHDSGEMGVNLAWRSPLFMPRWASRLTLEVTEVRVQRVQEISRSDADAEGVDYNTPGQAYEDPRKRFEVAWDWLNAKRGFPWSANPWVWAVSFRVLAEGAAKEGR